MVGFLKNNFVCSVLFSLPFVLAACDGSSGKNAESADDAELRDAAIAEEVDFVVAIYDELPVCTDKHEGATAYVKDEENAYVCDGDDWAEDFTLTNTIKQKIDDLAEESSDRKKGDCGKDFCLNNSSEQIACTEKIACTEAYYEPTGDVFLCDYDKDFKAWQWLIYMDSEGKKQNYCANRESSSNAKESVYNAKKNTLKDLRDGKTYRTVQIGGQIWMAENLNYETENSRCYRNVDSNCTKYGRLYFAGEASKVCPGGWTLPSEASYDSLFNRFGGRTTAARYLKADGIDSVGFSALLGGGDDNDEGHYYPLGRYAVFWTIGRYNYNYVVVMEKDLARVEVYFDDDPVLYSVRCIKKLEPGESARVKPCKTDNADNCEYGSLTDERDGQTYKTVKIGEQWWMAQNLNYADSVSTPSLKGRTACFDKDAKKCDTLGPGRTYTWAAAMDSIKLATDPIYPLDCGIGKTCNFPSVQGICPDGWHIPNRAEWDELLVSVGVDVAGEVLKSQTWWTYGGTDSYGFSASGLVFWGSDEMDENSAIAMNLGDERNFKVRLVAEYKAFEGGSIRCIKDNGSSSVKKKLAQPCKTGLVDNCEYGFLTDERDGQTYKIVKIGEQWWMVDNLNIKTENSYRFYWDDFRKDDIGYGRLYTWSAAMDSEGRWSADGKGCGVGSSSCPSTGSVRGVCPSGWHLPSKTEFEILIESIGGPSMGKKLKSIEMKDGLDVYGFCALPDGKTDRSGKFSWRSSVFFWTSTEDDASLAYDMFLGYDDMSDHGLFRNDKDEALSVRCIKDDGTEINVTQQPISYGEIALVKPCKTESEDNCEYGTLTDERDNQTYKTVKIGTQTWMAQNLNYKSGNSFCYDLDSTNCDKYGSLYTFISNKSAENMCPNGWHLPTVEEYETLFAAVAVDDFVGAGKALKSTSGWDEDGNGIDAYGFSALPAGRHDDNMFTGGYSSDMGLFTLFWCISERDSSSRYVGLSKSNSSARFYTPVSEINKIVVGPYAYSIRCIQD